MRIAAKTDVGQVRATNEDSFSAGELRGGAVRAVICDGMGGAAAGNVASQVAAKSISDAIAAGFQPGMGSRAVRQLLVAALETANRQVHSLAQQDELFAGMGTTVVAAVVTDSAAHIAHAGDSRAYLYNGTELQQLTKDHSVVQVMVDTGQITEDETKVHPRKNLITRALGVEETLDVDYCEQELHPGDVLLLCTDGLTNCVELEGAVPWLLGAYDFSLLAEQLVRLANENGGSDNITVAAVLIDKDQ